MTIRLPKKYLLDKILKIFGRGRKNIIPRDAEKIYQDFGPYIQLKSKKESFLRAIFRKKKCND